MCEVRWCRSRQVIAKVEGIDVCFRHYGLARTSLIKAAEVARKRRG